MPDSRPKPIALVKGHRTKAEIEQRKQAESLLVTGSSMREWPETRDNPVSHKYWLRLKKLYAAIDKNDALLEPVLNRYCVLLAECDSAQTEDVRLHKLLDDLYERNKEIDASDYFDMVIALNKQVLDNSKLLDSKRRMLLAIEKDNLMTLVSQMRAIPKKPEEKKATSGIAAYKARKEAR